MADPTAEPTPTGSSLAEPALPRQRSPEPGGTQEPPDPELGGPPEPDPEPDPESGAEPGPALAPARGRRSWFGLWVAVAAAVVLGVLVAGGFAVVSWLGDLGAEEIPEVGECLTGGSEDGGADQELEVVDCTAATAVWTVIGHDGQWRYDDFEAAAPEELCRDLPETGNALWLGPSPEDGGGDGEVICLARIDANGDDAE